jgi:hypothetical protein
LKDVFRRFDKNDDNKIAYKEFKEGLNKYFGDAVDLADSDLV